MKLLLDEQMPRKIYRLFPSDYVVSYVQAEGWAGARRRCAWRYVAGTYSTRIWLFEKMWWRIPAATANKSNTED